MDFGYSDEYLFRIDTLGENGNELAGLGTSKDHKFITGWK